MPGGNWKAPKLMPRSGGMRSLKSKAGVTGLCDAPRRGPSPCIALPWPLIWLYLPCSFCAWRNSHLWGGVTLRFLTGSLMPSPGGWACSATLLLPRTSVQHCCVPGEPGLTQFINCTAPPWVLHSLLEAHGTDHVLGLHVGSAEQPRASWVTGALKKDHSMITEG